MRMFEDMKSKVKDWKDDEEITAYLKALLHKEAFDKAGLIYGIGHAVYSLSDLVQQYSKNSFQTCL